MSDHILKTVDELEGKLVEQQKSISDTKRLINQLLELTGQRPRYADEDLAYKTGANLAIRSDQFYGQPLSTCVREILEMRRALNQGPATINEIYSALQEGGFAFDTKNDDNAKRGLRISITKNTAIFHKIPSGKIGLLEWYPNAKTSKAKKNSANDVAEEEGIEDPADDDNDEKDSA